MTELNEQEMIEILERIAREGGETARISAIRQLREIRRGDEPPEKPPHGSIQDTYRTKVTGGPRRKRGAGV